MASRSIGTHHKSLVAYHESLRGVEAISTTEGATSKAFDRLLDVLDEEAG